MLLALLRKNPVLWMSFSSSAMGTCGIVRGRAIFAEQVFGDDVHPLVRTLGGEDRRHEQFQRRVEVQRTRGVGVVAAEQADDRPQFLASPGPSGLAGRSSWRRVCLVLLVCAGPAMN